MGKLLRVFPIYRNERNLCQSLKNWQFLRGEVETFGDIEFLISKFRKCAGTCNQSGLQWDGLTNFGWHQEFGFYVQLQLHQVKTFTKSKFVDLIDFPNCNPQPSDQTCGT